MAVADLRQEYFDTLMEQAGQSPFPPSGLLDRVERTIGEPEQAEEYVEFLLATVQRMPPCFQLLDRIARVIKRLEVDQERRGRDQQRASSAQPEPSLDMKKAELIALAEDRGVDVPSKATKKDIVALLSA